jgi:hypothetical protein
MPNLCLSHGTIDYRSRGIINSYIPQSVVRQGHWIMEIFSSAPTQFCENAFVTKSMLTLCKLPLTARGLHKRFYPLISGTNDYKS